MGAYAVFWREMIILKRRLFRILASYAVSPLLFLIAFGWGMGRNLQVEGVDYLTFMIPGLIALSSMSQTFSIAMDINISRFYWMTFEEFQTAPISSVSVVLGEVFSGMVRGTLASFVILFLAFCFGVKLGVNGMLLFSVLLNTFMFGSAAVITSMVVKSHADQASFNGFFIVPMSFLCGTFFPLSRLPDWAYFMAQVLPLTHASSCIRAAALGINIPLISLMIMIIYSALFFLVAIACVKRASI
ncbi:MAG: ABC transporter permease [Thermodesulfobacteriota bacterium]|nr:ABC transporter permease [Thermodesulfobacteriota bacterium]